MSVPDWMIPVRAEETLASLNFAPDSFSHDATAHVEKEIEMKILDIGPVANRPQSTQIFFIQASSTRDSLDSHPDQKKVPF